MTQRQMLELLVKQVRHRVVRGGSWCSFGSNCRSAQCGSNDPDNRNYYFGFSVVLIRRQHDTKADA